MIEPFGKTYTWEVKLKLMGMQSEETARTMVSEYDLPITWQEFAEQSKAMAQQTMATAKLMPGKLPRQTVLMVVVFFFVSFFAHHPPTPPRHPPRDTSYTHTSHMPHPTPPPHPSRHIPG